jgi:ATP diphosphatase
MQSPDEEVRYANIAKAILKFCQTIARLRDPLTGCPWDLKQDHLSLRTYMIEEAYEAVDAMGASDTSALCGELGDVLLQVVLNAQIASEQENGFSFSDVIQSIDAKMIRRHPHVFEHKEGISTPEQVREQWNAIKAKEKPEGSSRSLFVEEAKIQPSLRQALAIGKRAATVKFDWTEVAEVIAVVKGETRELEEAIISGSSVDIAEELGDVLFSVVQLSRHLNHDPEILLRDANRKFLRRFAAMEDKATKRDMTQLSRDELEQLWKQVKIEEKKTEANK